MLSDCDKAAQPKLALVRLSREERQLFLKNTLTIKPIVKAD